MCTHCHEGRDSDWFLPVGHSAVVPAHTCLWRPTHTCSCRLQPLMPSGGGALLPQSVQRKNLLWWCPWLTCPQPWCLASLVVPDFFTCTRDCGSPTSQAVHWLILSLSGYDPEARAHHPAPSHTVDKHVRLGVLRSLSTLPSANL